MQLDPTRDEIESLKKEIATEIVTREALGSTIQNYICVNNLKSKLSRLETVEQILSIGKYTLVFIGTIGEGKTTAICHLLNLLGTFNATKTVGGKPRTFKETQELLATGEGRRTVCDVVIKSADQTYIEIEPYTHEQMENMISDFCDSLSEPPEVQGEPRVPLSKEIENAIRTVVQMKRTSVTTPDGDKRIDQAKEEFEKSGLTGLKEKALRNANLGNRTVTKIAYDGKEDERLWIKNTFVRVNDAELPTVAIPRTIHVGVSSRLLSMSSLPQFEAVIDTKGIDENAIRKDLQRHIERPDTICLFATGFKDAPEANIRNLMKYHLSSKSRDFHHRFVTFVVTHKGQPEKINGGDGSWATGTEIRREDIQTVFRNLGLEFFPANILFFDALRYYYPDRNVLDESLYTHSELTPCCPKTKY